MSADARTGFDRIVSRHLDGRVSLIAGAVTFDELTRVTEPFEAGLRVVVVLSGHMTLSADGREPIVVRAPTVFTVLGDGGHARDQLFEPGETYCYTLVQVDPLVIQAELGLDPFALLGLAPDRSNAQIVVLARPATAALRAVAAQILTCPGGRAYAFYRLAKAFELVSLALEPLLQPPEDRARGRLSADDVERVRAARDRLVEALGGPPDLALLAGEVGLNPRKLSDGFRLVFGATPYAYLQEHRLQLARSRLVSGERSIGEVAYAVGYSPAHFATLFRRRFGLSPSAVVRGRP